jgi:hypothetical protein
MDDFLPVSDRFASDTAVAQMSGSNLINLTVLGAVVKDRGILECNAAVVHQYPR